KALDEALELADRAVRATGHRDPNVLDTLAEAQFRGGDAQAALSTIDEAIALAPDQAYFREQRRRFAGERAADDRPAPPGESAPVREPIPNREAPPFEAPGISIGGAIGSRFPRGRAPPRRPRRSQRPPRCGTARRRAAADAGASRPGAAR